MCLCGVKQNTYARTILLPWQSSIYIVKLSIFSIPLFQMHPDSLVEPVTAYLKQNLN
jgi:hypothetical protein